MALTQIPPVMIDGGLGLDWQSSVETSSFVAVNGNGYFVNTTSGSITVTMPSSPTVGDSIGIIDYAGTAASNTITLTSSNNIQGSSDNKIVNYTRGALRITYADTTQGWVASAAANDGTSALNPIPSILIDFLVVAGGGGGGAASGGGGGGGGAGGLLTNFGATAFTAFTGTAYDIEVGTNGTGATTSADAGTSGGNSKFTSSYISLGGGGGSGYNDSGLIGGSGGGGAGNMVSSPGISGTAGQGTSGGDGGGDGTTGGGGGGGKDGSGTNATSTSGGNGGASLEVNIIGGTGNYYAGGGGGGLDSRTNGSVGTGGTSSGGNGGGSSTGNQATTGVINTGGGGGGDGYPTSSYPAKNGGSGIVILRYPTVDVSSFAVTGTLDTVADIAYPITNTAYYKLNGGSGTTVTDSSGNGYNGTATSVTYAAGRFGDAAVFNGSSSFVTLPDSSSISQINNFSWSFWVKPNGFVAYGTIATFYSDYRNYVDIRTGGILGFQTTSGNQLNTPTNSIANGVWQHVALTKSSTAGTAIYINGVSVATNTSDTGNASDFTGSNYQQVMGSYSATGSDFFPGSIDQFRIFSSVLSAGNVTSLYNEATIIESTDGNDSILQFTGGTGTITFS